MAGFFKIAVLFTLTSLALSAAVVGRPQSAELSGEVRDQRGDLVVGAVVSLASGASPTRNAESDARGRFRFDGLTPGDYILKVAAQRFAAREERLTLMSAAASRQLTITLYPAIRETLDVSDDGNAVSLDPDRAAGAQVLREEQLRLAPADPDRFRDFLQLLSTSSGSAP